MSHFIIDNIKIAGITSSVPELTFDTSYEKLPIIHVRRSQTEQTTSDLAYDAALRLLEEYHIDKEKVGLLLFVSRTPDYRSPNTAAILQGRLGLSLDCICSDINKGNNGLVSGLLTGSSILNTINKPYGLVLFGDTSSKLNLEDNHFGSIESDAASAVLLEKVDGKGYSITAKINSFGEYFKNYAIPKGGFRFYDPHFPFDATDKDSFKLVFDKKSIQDFLDVNYPRFIQDCKGEIESEDYLLLHADLLLLGIDGGQQGSTLDKNSLEKFGKTAGSNLPLQLDLLAHLQDDNKQLSIACIGFGEGLELAFIKFSINTSNILPTKVFTDYFSDFRVSHEM